MTGIDAIIAENEAATSELLAAAHAIGEAWDTPRAAGQWTPAQVVEHVSLTLEQGAAAVSGGPSRLPTFPALLRPIARAFYYNRVLKKGVFPPTRTTSALEPAAAGATLDDACLRLRSASRLFNDACRQRAVTGSDFAHPVFGMVSIESYARFQALHTRHHRTQISAPHARQGPILAALSGSCSRPAGGGPA